MSELLRLDGVRKSFGDHVVLREVDLTIEPGQCVVLIGASGSGKSTLLRCVNLLEVVDDGVITFEGRDITDPRVDGDEVRSRMGMVFQKSNPFPMSIYENVIYPLRIDGENRRRVLDETVERSLRSAALWDEAKDRLHDSALELSGGQQQRLCIARAIAADPEVLLMDEPCSALDPIATAKVEELIFSLRGEYTVLIVTHNMQQAARVSDFTAFMYLGDLIEHGPTATIFSQPSKQQTEDYITGRFG